MAWQKEVWRPERSLPEVLQDMMGNVQHIIRSEIRLAKAEMKERAAAALKPGDMLAAGALFGLYAGGLLLLMCVYALATVVAPWLAALIVGLSAAAISAVLVMTAVDRLKKINPKPEKTIETLKENVEWAKHQIK